MFAGGFGMLSEVLDKGSPLFVLADPLLGSVLSLREGQGMASSATPASLCGAFL